MLVGTLLFAASFVMTPPEEPLASSLRQAIWYDLKVNAMIGNGNWIGSLWYNAGSDGAGSNLHLNDLVCRGGASRKSCEFTLFREGGPTEAMGEVAPATMICTAILTVDRKKGEWLVLHYPPKKIGHSKTSMRCNSADH